VPLNRPFQGAYWLFKVTTMSFGVAPSAMPMTWS